MKSSFISADAHSECHWLIDNSSQLPNIKTRKIKAQRQKIKIIPNTKRRRNTKNVNKKSETLWYRPMQIWSGTGWLITPSSHQTLKPEKSKERNTKAQNQNRTKHKTQKKHKKCKKIWNTVMSADANLEWQRLIDYSFQQLNIETRKIKWKTHKNTKSKSY